MQNIAYFQFLYLTKIANDIIVDICMLPCWRFFGERASIISAINGLTINKLMVLEFCTSVELLKCQ